MFQKVRPYMGGYIRYTKRAAVAVTLAVILSVIPYFLLYQIIAPLTEGVSLTFGFVALRVAVTAVCLAGNAILYVHGLDLSHHSAYNTLKNLRIALQGELEQQPLGTIRELGNGRIRQVELLFPVHLPRFCTKDAVPCKCRSDVLLRVKNSSKIIVKKSRSIRRRRRPLTSSGRGICRLSGS